MKLAPIAPNTLLFAGDIYHRNLDEPTGQLIESRIYRGAQIGDAHGYSTFDDAIRAAGFLSDEAGPRGGGATAIAIVRDGARFNTFLSRVREPNPETGALGSNLPLELGNHLSYYADLGRPSFVHDGVVAFVDGTYVELIGR